jgi:hypothetical protein
MSRLQGGEIVDVVILSAASLDELIRLGVITKEGRYDLARCGNWCCRSDRRFRSPGSIWSDRYRRTFRR